MDWLSKIVQFFSELIAPQEIETARIEAMRAEDFDSRATPLKIGREIAGTIIPFEYESPIVIWSWKTIVFIHSEERMRCGIYSALGTAVMWWAHPHSLIAVVIGAAVGATISELVYHFISKRFVVARTAGSIYLRNLIFTDLAFSLEDLDKPKTP